jgi:hypothetical protein
VRDTLVRRQEGAVRRRPESLVRRPEPVCRVSAPGAEIEILVLASGRRSCVGIDLASGAFVRTHQSLPNRELLPRFTTAIGVLAPATIPPRPEQPEAVDLTGRLEPTGRLAGWRGERMLRAVLHPEGRPILGMNGPSIPCWTIEGDRPSVALVAPTSEVRVRVTEHGVRAMFAWHRSLIDAPLEDPTLLAQLDWLPHRDLYGSTLIRAVGFRPERLVMALSRPRNGHCYRVVASLLPRH